MGKIQSRIRKNVEIREFIYEVDDIRIDFGTVKFAEDGEILSIDNGAIFLGEDRVCEFQIYGDVSTETDFRRFAVNIEYAYIDFIKHIFDAIDTISKKDFEDVKVFDFEKREAIAIERARLEAEAQMKALEEAEVQMKENMEETDTITES